MSGDHLKWEDMKAYVSRGRLCRLRFPHRVSNLRYHSSTMQLCSIRDRTARYVHLRTSVPYATPAAYRYTMILNHEYVWSHALGCYLTCPDLFTTPDELILPGLR